MAALGRALEAEKRKAESEHLLREAEQKLVAGVLMLQWVTSLAEFEAWRPLGVGKYEVALECRPRDPILAAELSACTVKVVLTAPAKAVTATAVKDYRAECRLLARLNHPNIARMLCAMGPLEPTVELLQLLDDQTRSLMVDARTGLPYKTTAAVMEFSQQTLKQLLLKRGRTLTPAQLLTMCWELLQALRFLSQRRLAHLNLKTDNILVAANGRLMLSDFSNAKQMDAGGYVATKEPLYGNLEHMAPEVIFAVYSMRNLSPGDTAKIPVSGQGAVVLRAALHPNVSRLCPPSLYLIFSMSARFSSSLCLSAFSAR